jgi:TetR/AcrR family transcriptional regulator, transcriptional repressor for nem operon
VRYASNHNERTRDRIVTAAARRFREKGFGGAGVDDVMASAGLTAGAFYGHFDSKEALLAEALAAGVPHTVERLTAGLETLDGVAWLREVVRRYLSRSHRKDVAEGCALPALTAEVARQGPRARKAFEAYLRGIVRALEGKAPGGPGLSPEDRMLATVALFAGGLMLARAVHDERLSDRILRACRRLAVPEACAGETAATSREEGSEP